MTLGRDAIVKSFQEVFDNTPDALVDEIAIERVRFITSTVALEEGVVATTAYRGGARELSRYIALHVKGRDGEWRINTLKDYTRDKGTRDAPRRAPVRSWPSSFLLRAAMKSSDLANPTDDTRQRASACLSTFRAINNCVPVSDSR